MSIIQQMIRNQGMSGTLVLSKEEFDELETEVLGVVEDESDEIDEEFDEVEAVEGAAASLEQLAAFLAKDVTGLSTEGYTHLMNTANGILAAAGVGGQMTNFSTESDEEATPEARKETMGDKLRQKAGNLKDAGMEAIKKLFRIIQGFFEKFFGRIESVKKAAAGKAQQLSGVGTAKIKVSAEWAKQMQKMGELERVSKEIGAKSVAAIKMVKHGTDGLEAVSKIAAITRVRIPAGLVGNPTFVPDEGRITYEFPELKGGTTAYIQPAMGKTALESVVRICDDILAQRNALRGSVLTEQEKRVYTTFAQGDAAKSFNQILKMINDTYRGWVTYVGRVCMGITHAIGTAGAAPAEAGEGAEAQA